MEQHMTDDLLIGRRIGRRQRLCTREAAVESRDMFMCRELMGGVTINLGFGE